MYTAHQTHFLCRPRVAVAIAAACLLALPKADAKPPHGRAAYAAAPMAQAAEGEVQRLLINPYGDIDGLQLTDGRVVKFAPHMGTELGKVVTPGQTVRVSAGRPEGANTIKAYALVNVTNGRVIEELPPAYPRVPRHLRAAFLQAQEAEGTIATVLTGRHGEPNGVILDSGVIVRFPPHSLTTALIPGQAFAARGFGTRNAHGLALEAVSMGASLATLQPLHLPDHRRR